MANPESIGKYEILDKIGEGGFGVVYKGRDPFIKRLVAVKTCSSADQGIQQRFFREAEIAGNLHHANVVTIHDFGIEGDTPYLVQEYLAGYDLDELIHDPPESLTIGHKVSILRGVAEGLRYAHNHGVIHRDIKPGNVRVLENGQVKVMDFGIAKLKDVQSQLTQTGMTLGTVAYLSPEQLKGQEIDHRVDVFSYGVLAYELFSGQRPFRADTVSTLFYKLLNEEPEPLDNRELPDNVIETIQRCMAKKPADRYQDFGAVLEALDQVQRELTDSELPDRELPDSQLPELPDSGDSDIDPYQPSSAGTGAGALHGLAVKAKRALIEQDLTAAEMTLKMARRELDSLAFQRVFGQLVRELDELKQQIENQSQLEPLPGAASQEAHTVQKVQTLQTTLQKLRTIEGQLDQEEFHSAAIALTALEQQHPDMAELEPLRDRLDHFHRMRRLDPGRTLLAESHDLEKGKGADSSARKPLDRRILIALLAGGGALLAVLLVIGISKGSSETARPSPDPMSEALLVENLREPSTLRALFGSTDTDVLPQTALDELQPPGTEEAAATRATTPSATRSEPAIKPQAPTSSDEPAAEEPVEDVAPAIQPPAPQEPSPAEMAAARETERQKQQIRTVMQNFRNAWRSLDLRAINAVHPNAAVRKDVRPYSAAEVEIDQCVIDIQGETARALCTIVKTLKRKNRPDTVQNYTGMMLRRSGAGWVVDSLF